MAQGKLYLLTNEYTGTPQALSLSTPGLVGVGSASGSVYVFAPSLALSPNTQYFFYADSVPGGIGGTEQGAGPGYPGGSRFGAANGTDIFVTRPGDVSFSLNGVGPDYTVTTTGNAIVITDVSGNSDTLTVSEPAAGNLKFAAAGRTFGVNGGATTANDSGNLSRSGVTQITVNAGAGNDTINLGAFTGTLPSLTINGGAGDDTVNFNGDITFAANANLDMDLQNDDATPGNDSVVLGANAHLIASGTGSITIRVSQTIATFAGGNSLQTVNGDITLEANQQAAQTAGSFYGIQASGTLVQASGTGNITIKGRGSVGGSSVAGIAIDPNTTVRVNTGTITMVGVGGNNAGLQNNGLQVHQGSVVESTNGGPINLTGTSGPQGMGIRVLLGGIVRSTGAGSIALTGTGGSSVSGTINYGVSLDNNGSVTINGSGSITINAIAGANATAFFTSTGTNRLGFDGVNAYSGNIIINADSIDIANAIIQTTGTATLRQKTNGQLINLGAADSLGLLGLTDAELDQVAAGTVQIGDANSGAITVSAVISPASYKTLAFGNNVTFAATGGFSVDVGPTAATYEKMTVVGTATLSAGATLSIAATGGYVPAAADSFILLDNDGADAITGSFSGLPEGALVNVNGVNRRITYLGGTGNDLALQPVLAEIAVEQPVGSNITDGGTKNFGNVNLGASNGLTFTITNLGDADLILTNITKDGANSGDFTVGAVGSTTVTLGSSTTFTVTFTPGANGSRSAALHIANNDSDENPFDLNLTGNGAVPEIAVEQPSGTNLPDGGSQSFGVATVGASNSLTFTIRNTGLADLKLGAITKDGANPGDFTVGAVGSTNVTPGNTITFSVTFTPTTVGAKSAVLHLANNDADENPFDILIYGATPPPPTLATLPDLKLSKAGVVSAITVQPDGKIIIGGDFTSVNDVPRTNLARLNPNGSVDLTWNPVVNFPYGGVLALVLNGTDIFIGGVGFSPGGLAKGTTLGNGELDANWHPSVFSVYSMAISGPNLYVGGQAALAKVSTTGSGTVDPSWNPNPTDNGSFNYFVNAVLVDGTNVFVGGRFTSIGGANRNSLAKLSAQTGVADSDWDAHIGASFCCGGDPVQKLAISGTNLFVGGGFLDIGGTNISYAAKLTTTGSGAVDPAWRPSPYSVVSAIAASSTEVYMAMQNPCRAGLGCVAGRLTRTSATGNGMPDPAWHVEVGPDYYYAFVRALVLTDSSVLVGSSLATVNAEVSLGIMKLDRITGARDPGFSAHAQSPGSVKAIARQSDGKVIIGGDFWFAGGLPRHNLARVNQDGTLDRTWAPKADDLVNAVVLGGNDAFVGGRFTQVSGIQRPAIAKIATQGSDAVDLAWNASSNADVQNDGVLALALDGTNLFAAGGFYGLGGAGQFGLAKLRTSGSGAADPTWQPNLADGLGGMSLAVSGPNLFVGGGFTTIGGASRENIAKLTTTGSGNADPTWNPQIHPGARVCSSGNYVTSLMVDGTNLFVGGNFDNIGGQRRRGLAKLAAQGSGQADPMWDPVGEPPAVNLPGPLSLRFNGPGYVRTTRMTTNPQNFTLSLWFNTTSTTGGRLLGLGDQQTGLSTLFDRHLYVDEAGQVNFGMLSPPAVQNIVKSGPSKNDGQWHQVTATFSSTNGMKLYLDGNGVPVAVNASVTNPVAYTGWWRIGWDNGWLANPTASFAGLIDEVQIWDRVRSASEITNSFDQPLVGNEPGLVSYWRLDEYACGNSADDATGSGNTGAFVGSGPTWEFTGFPARKASGYSFYKVDSLALVGTNLYAGGVFAGMGGVARNNLARVNPAGTGNVDSSFDPGPVGRSDYDGSIQSSVVRALLLNRRDLYVGGGFTTIGGAPRSGFAFLPVADAPVLIQDTTTNLFITRNPEDGPEVTHFRIIGLSGGPLFKADGVTPVNVGDFITVAEGAAGLKFVVGGSLTAVSALNDAPDGAGTAIASLTTVANPPPVLAFSPPTYSVREGQGNVVVTVRKYGDGTASVNYATSNLTATAGADFQGRTGTLSFSTAEKLKNLIILIGDDFVAEGDEQFAVHLSNETNAPIIGPRTAIVTIADNDGAGSQTVAAQPPTLAPPPAGGALVLNLLPLLANGQWRLVGELNWHNGGGTVSGLVTGNYQVEFRQVSGYYPPSADAITIPIAAGMTNELNFFYAITDTSQMGNLSVRIEPGDVAGAVDMNLRGQWRWQGTTNWLDHGDLVPNLSAGSYAVEFKPVIGHATPLPQLIQVGGAGAIYSGVGTYFFASTPGAVMTPEVLPFGTATTNAPYLYNGQLQTSVGFGSGFVVKPRVVLTAAHVLFDDVLLSYSTDTRWFFQRYRDQLEPVPQVPRGWYIFGGYASQRQLDNSPGLSTPASQNLDAAALYFLDPEGAGRGGYGGYLSSDADDNEHLLSANNKFLAGYPLAGVAETNQGKLFATAPANLTFRHLYTSIFATTDIQSFPGNSGGPLYVQTDVDKYLPAALLLGGAGETLVRAINSDVVDLINRAEISGNGGGNIVDGGVTLLSAGLSAPPFGTGLLTVRLTPLNVAGARSGWRITGITDTNYFTDALTTVGLIGGQGCPIEFKPVPGFITPSDRTVQITVGQVVTIQADYVPIGRPLLSLNRATGLSLFGAIGGTYRVEFTTNLSATMTWTPLTTQTLSSSTLTISNTLPATTGRRFYRAVLVP